MSVGHHTQTQELRQMEILVLYVETIFSRAAQTDHPQTVHNLLTDCLMDTAHKTSSYSTCKNQKLRSDWLPSPSFPKSE